MSALGPTAFAALVWGVLGLVGVVFGYEAYAVIREFRIRDETASGDRR